MTPVGSRTRALEAVLVLLTLVVSVISALGAPLLPTIARQFDTTISNAEWSLTAGLLSGAVAAPILGRLGDGPRRRAALLWGLAVVTAGGVVAALAPNLAVLVTGRALQGTGLGLVPLAMATAREELPTPRVAPMIALLSVTAAAGVGVGYPLSGLVAQSLGLSWAYWFGAIVSALALVGVAIAVPNPRGSSFGRLDTVGATLLTVGLVTLLIAVSEGSEWGWGSARTLVLFAVALVGLIAWIKQSNQSSDPVVNLQLMRHPSVRAADVCAFILGVAMYMDLSAVTAFVQVRTSVGYGDDASPVVAGLTLVPLSVFMLSGSRLVPPVSRRLGIRTLLASGCLLVAVSGAFFALWHGALWQAMVMMGVLGVGLGTTFAAIPGMIVSAVPPQETGSAMGFYQVVRYVGFALGSALTGTILASRLQADGQPTQGDYVVVFWVSVAICVVAAAFSWVLADKVRTSAAAPPDEAELRMAEITDGEDIAFSQS